MNILKTPYLQQENPELNGTSFEEPFLSRQMSSPFLTDIVFDEEATQDLLEEDYEIFDNEYTSEEDEFEEDWDDDFEDEFVEFGADDYEKEIAYGDYEDTSDDNELEEEVEFEENECTCNEDELDEEIEVYNDNFQEKFEEEQFNEFKYNDFDYQEKVDEGIDNEFNDYEEVEEEIDEDFYGYEEDSELEEAFFSSFKKYFDRWTQKKKVTNPATLSPQKSISSKLLKLPIVSTLLPDSNNYLKTKNSPEKYYGIPETIAALQWIGKEWVKLHSNVQFIIRDISQMGGGWIKGHGSHRMGIDVDVRLRIEGKLISSRRQNYRSHRKYVRDLITIVTKNPYLSIAVIGFQDCVLNNEFDKLVRPWKNHSRHLHLRFCMPSNRISKADFKKVYPKGSKGSFKTCGVDDVTYTKPVVATSTTKPQSINIQDAIRYNRQKKYSLGWVKHLKRIHFFLGYPLYSPDDSQFAKAVALWQRRNGFRERDIDGKVGPSTWAKMKSVFGITSKTSATALNSSAPVNFQNLSQGKKIPENINKLREFRLTTYYVEDQKDYPTGNIKIPIYDINKNIISFASPRFFAKLSLEGSAKLTNGRLVNVTGKKVTVSHNEYSAVLDYHKVAYAKRNRARISNGRKPISTGYSGIVTQNNQVKKALAFYAVPHAKVGLGFGTQRGIKMVPFRTLAADIGHVKYNKVERKWKGKGGIIPPKTRVYIKEYEGLILPDKSIHDGWFIVNDTGGGIYGAHLDVFVGTKKLRKEMKLPPIGHVWFEGIEKRVPVGYSYGLKP